MTSVVACNGLDISVLDERKYECITLENSLQVLLISDPATEKSSAAMDVHVGHQSDPEQLPGLAHFLEHMLFLGTEKYPDENSYKQYLSAHSGRSNASTSQMHTNYYFDVLSDHFHEALDRFAQFFIAPLFTPSATEREMNAVNSENAKNLQNDHRRLYQLQKSLSNPKHPFHKFGTGNLETLGDRPKAQGIDVRKALLEFHATYYSASIMKLVLCGKEDLTTLKQWAQGMFASIKNTGRSFPVFDGAIPYDDSRLPREIHVAPVKDLRTINISWPLPPLYWEFLTKPSKILSHLLGHEGQGSILSFLKAQKWANGLSAGLSRDNEDWSMFTVNVDATDSGIEHAHEVVAAVYQYVHLLQREAPFPSWIFQETQDLASIDFRFKSKESPISYTSYLGGVMHRFPPKYIVSGGHLLYEYDAAKVQEILNLLTPQRMRLTIVSKRFDGKTESIEPWYSTPYTESKIDVQVVTQWERLAPNGQLRLPHPNEFICSDFRIVTAESTTPGYHFVPPQLVQDDEHCRLWFKPETYFRKPKLSLSFLLYSPVISTTPYHAVLTSLFLRYLKDELTECAYDAELAGMDYEISFNSRAIELHVGGYSHKLPALLFKVLQQMLAMTKDGYKYEESVFGRVKDRTARMYANFFLEEPYQHAVYAASLLLEESKWSVDEKIEAIQKLSLHDLVSHAQFLFQQVFVEGLFYGNVDRGTTTTLMQNVLSEFAFGKPGGAFPMLPSQDRKPRIVQLADATEYTYQRSEWNPNNLNSSICTLYQIEQESLELRARLELFAHVFKEPCFNQLRTQEQLGYLVFSGLMRNEGIEYFRILIQSNVASPAVLDQRIELFLHQFRALLVDMPEALWHKHVNAVVKALLEKPKREVEEGTRIWREIASQMYLFGRRERVAEHVATLQKRDLLAFFDSFIAVEGAKRSKLTVRLYGAKHELPTVQWASAPTNAGSATATCLTASMILQSQINESKGINAPASVSITDLTGFKSAMMLFPERLRPSTPAKL